MKHWFFLFENMYFCCTKIQKILSTLGTEYFLKIAKIIPSKKKHLTLSKSQKLVPAKHKKSPIRKNKLPQKFHATRYVGLCKYFFT